MNPSEVWVPDAAAIASIRRGIADADAGRTAPIDQVLQECVDSAEPDFFENLSCVEAGSVFATSDKSSTL